MNNPSPSSAFLKFKAERIYTVEQLIAKLQMLPPTMGICGIGADLGGYDVSHTPYCIVYTSGGKVCISHDEYDVYQAMSKGKITQEEYELLDSHND